ncbi:unnamed protein product [Schistocephalus solidus]|uniref:DUF1330 domain-containing protein n=1 Tax=Schistocephalus solidus TaxID=70667 RepID=A0A183TNM0_SCHSO|nr:unnamed protein product [Schistocephalus solidus]
MARMSEKEYNEFIGNRNPYSGPGRYTPYEYEDAHNRRFQGLFKVVPRIFDVQKYKVQRRILLNTEQAWPAIMRGSNPDSRDC